MYAREADIRGAFSMICKRNSVKMACIAVLLETSLETRFFFRHEKTVNISFSNHQKRFVNFLNFHTTISKHFFPYSCFQIPTIYIEIPAYIKQRVAPPHQIHNLIILYITNPIRKEKKKKRATTDRARTRQGSI